jgi:hypothetical protein
VSFKAGVSQKIYHLYEEGSREWEDPDNSSVSGKPLSKSLS